MSKEALEAFHQPAANDNHPHEEAARAPSIEEMIEDFKEQYHNPTIERVIEEEMPRILKSDPQFFVRNQINVSNVGERIAEMYTERPDLASYAFKVWLRQVRYILETYPEDPGEDLEEAVVNIRKILNGEWKDDITNGDEKREDNVVDLSVISKATAMRFLNQIPNTFTVDELKYPLFESFESIAAKVVAPAVPFLNESEKRKVAFQINSAGQELELKAAKAKEIIEFYLKELREVGANADLPLPDYYNLEDKVISQINLIRKSVKA